MAPPSTVVGCRNNAHRSDGPELPTLAGAAATCPEPETSFLSRNPRRLITRTRRNLLGPVSTVPKHRVDASNLCQFQSVLSTGPKLGTKSRISLTANN
jgi:hypothetical protein